MPYASSLRRIAPVVLLTAAVLGGVRWAAGQTLVRLPGDPKPLEASAQWVLDLRYERGNVFLVGAQRRELAEPQRTGRAMGRFALELFEGSTLIERVRFDFPLLGGAWPDAAAPAALADADASARVASERRDPDAGAPRPLAVPSPDFREGLGTSRIGVLFPATARGNRLELVDRASGRRWTLPWPLVEAHAGADAGR